MKHAWCAPEEEPLFIVILDKAFRDDELAGAVIACSEQGVLYHSEQHLLVQTLCRLE